MHTTHVRQTYTFFKDRDDKGNPLSRIFPTRKDDGLRMSFAIYTYSIIIFKILIFTFFGTLMVVISLYDSSLSYPYWNYLIINFN